MYHFLSGREHNVGIFISLVTRGLQADIVGLKVHSIYTGILNIILTRNTTFARTSEARLDFLVLVSGCLLVSSFKL